MIPTTVARIFSCAASKPDEWFGLASGNLRWAGEHLGFGIPLLFGGISIPSALTTILAFTTLAVAVLIFAGWPKSLRRDAPAFPLSLGAIIVVLAAGIVAAGYDYSLSFERSFRRSTEEELMAIAQLKADELARWRKERMADGSLFFQNPAFSSLVRRLLADPADAAVRRELQMWLRKGEAYGQYDQFRLLDAQGVTHLSVPDTLKPVSPTIAQAAAETLRSGQPILQDFYRHDVNGQVYLAVVVPIFDDPDVSHPLGALVLRIDPTTYLYPFIQRWPTPSTSAETLIIRREGGNAVYLNELRFRQNSALTLEIPLERTEVPATRAIAGETGIMQGVDYRGAPVLAAVRRVSDSPWYLVAKMDSAEVNAPLREQMWGTALLVGVLLFGMGAGVSLFWRRHRVRHFRERLEAAEALRESNELFSLYMHHSPIYTYIKAVTPTENRVVRASENFQQMLGCSDAAIEGKTMAELFPSEFAKKITADDWAVVAGGKALKLEEDFNGRHYTTIKFPIVHGTKTLLAGYTIDITERRTAEKTLRLQGAALEAAANAIIITDRQGAIEWANPAFSSLSGWPFAEVLGKNPRDLVKSGEHDAAFYRQMWDTLLAGKVWQGEIVNRRKDGALRTEDMTITPLRDEQGEIAHFIAIKQDVTQYKTMEAHFLQAQRMEAIGALAGGIAHDLNNILTPIAMVTAMLKDKLTTESDRELLAMAQSNARRGAEIIKQLLTFSRGQDGERTAVQARHLITEMLTMMRETFPRELDLQQQLPSNLWTVIADPTQLHQVLMNLCVNARDAMPDGGRLTIGAANVTLTDGDPKLPPRAKSGPYVVIAISDTGHGIPTTIKHRIFDPFFTTKPLGKGTGLGLSTVLGIVQSHGGFVDVESTSHKGSTFQVFLPAIPDGAEAVPEAPASPASPASPGTGCQTILVVDDERNVRAAMRALLEQHHYRVMTAVHGEDALAQYLLHQTEIDLVLTDLMMPVMNGMALVRALRAIDPALKIIAMSGLVELPQERELAALAMPEVLMKPWDVPTLVETVRRRLAG